MASFLYRAAISDRVFPAIGWRSENGDGTAATELLISGHFSVAALMSGRNPGALQVLRAVWLHCEASKAEASGRYEYADFLFMELDRDLKAVETKGAWASAADLVQGAPADLPASELRARLLREIFLDTHLAFYNAAVAENKPITASDRAFLHLTRAETFRKQASPGDDELERAIAAAKIAALREGKAFAAATDFIASFGDRFPGIGQALALSRLAQLGHELGQKSSGATQIAILARTIRNLQSDLERFPNECSIHEVLGHAYSRLSIEQANSKQLADALVSNRRAIHHHPHLQDAIELEKQLFESMNGLQKNMQEVEQRIRSNPNAQLTPEGQELRKQASMGFSALARYVESAEAANIQAQSRRARAVYLWQRIGLPQLQTGEEARALALVTFIDEILKQDGSANIDRAKAGEILERIPDAAGIDMDRVLLFLQAPEKFPGEIEDPFTALPLRDDVPVASKAADFKVQRGIPAKIWLRSAQTRGTRILMAASALIVIVSGGALLYDYNARSEELKVFAELRAAIDNYDEAAAANAASRLQAIKPLASINKPREIAGVLTKELRELPNKRLRKAALGEMVRASRDGKHVAVLDAAERYLKAPPIGEADEDRAQVRELYAKHLMRWLATYDNSEAEIQRRLAIYRQLKNNLKA